MGILEVVTPFVIAFAYIPQVVHLHKVKDATGIDLKFWFILDGGIMLMLRQSIIQGATNLIVTQSVNLGLALVVTGQVIYYRKNTR